jgi:hypothetical protein
MGSGKGHVREGNRESAAMPQVNCRQHALELR